MPAVTADTLTLPKLTTPPVDAVERQIRSITRGPKGYEGEGFPVHRAFAGVALEDLDPFIHMDQMGSVDYRPGEPRGTDWHPHRGFETVTYILDGTFQHQDSHGGGGVITNGATQWMTAGRGILHIETPPEELVVSGGLFHGVQLWVNLPAKDKLVDPRYQNLESDLVTLLSSPDGGALVRVIAGVIDGHGGPGATYTPITVAHATVAPGARLVVPWNPAFNALGYVLSGAGAVGDASIDSGNLVLFGDALRSDGSAGRGDTVTFSGRGTQPLELLLLGGQPIREPIATYGPFVMNTRAEIAKAVEDYRAGRLGQVPTGGLRPYHVGR